MKQCDFLKSIIETPGRDNNFTNELIKIFQSFNQYNIEEFIPQAEWIASLGCQLNGPPRSLITLFQAAVKATEDPIVAQSIRDQLQNQEIWPLENFAQMITYIEHFNNINAANTPELPCDPKGVVFSYLDFRSLLNMRIVSKDYLLASKQTTNLDLSFKNITDLAFRVIPSVFPNLESLSLSSASIECEESFEHLKGLSKLKILNLENCSTLRNLVTRSCPSIDFQFLNHQVHVNLPFFPEIRRKSRFFVISLIDNIDFAFSCPSLKSIDLSSAQIKNVQMNHPNIEIQKINETSSRVLLNNEQG